MANKTWDYLVSYIDPEDLSTKTPAKRGELEFECKATTVGRALTMAKKYIIETHSLDGARDVVIVDVVREASPLVAEWA